MRELRIRVLWVKDEGRVGKLRDPYFLLTRKRMVRRENDHHAFAQQRQRGASRYGGNLPADTNVNTRLMQCIGLLFSEHFEELQLDLGVIPMKRLKCRRQHAVHR